MSISLACVGEANICKRKKAESEEILGKRCAKCKSENHKTKKEEDLGELAHTELQFASHKCPGKALGKSYPLFLTREHSEQSVDLIYRR